MDRDQWQIRPLRDGEINAWIELRGKLWPDTADEILAAEAAEIRADACSNVVLVAATAAEELIGFAEASIRDWAEGCRSRPVGYLEGWYVDPAHRRCGLGRALVNAAEQWAASHGCSEFGSDAELANLTSRTAHAALGFKEVVVLVSFRKPIRPDHCESLNLPGWVA